MVNLTFIENNEYKKLAEKGTFTVLYGYHDTPFGKCLIGVKGNKICHLSFVQKELEKLDQLKKQWPKAVLERNQEKTSSMAEKAFGEERDSLEIVTKGSEFQELVWRGLLKIPEGRTCSYEELAKNVGKPAATRACANAVKSNWIAYLIPCHRVIKKSGQIHGFMGVTSGWQCEIKRKILIAEKKKQDSSG